MYNYLSASCLVASLIALQMFLRSLFRLDKRRCHRMTLFVAGRCRNGSGKCRLFRLSCLCIASAVKGLG